MQGGRNHRQDLKGNQTTHYKKRHEGATSIEKMTEGATTWCTMRGGKQAVTRREHNHNHNEELEGNQTT